MAQPNGPVEGYFYELPFDERADRVAEVYDPATGRFRVTGEVPIDPFWLDGLVPLADGGALLFGAASRPGGEEEDQWWTAVLRYDPATNRWREAGRLAIARERPTIALLPDGPCSSRAAPTSSARP